MTAQQETLFVCDRCQAKQVVPLANTPTPARGLVAPERWLTLWRNEITRAPVHLCPDCASQFDQLMAGASS